MLLRINLQMCQEVNYLDLETFETAKEFKIFSSGMVIEALFWGLWFLSAFYLINFQFKIFVGHKWSYGHTN